MAQSDITISLDNQIKSKFERLCEQLGMSVNTDDAVKRRAIAAFQHQRRIAESNPDPEMTLEEINEEIRATRRERAKTKKS
jgi:antitoxin component of RelBE/YafQ-DinJ toxin-antitoxin module